MTRDDVINIATEAGLLEPGYLHGDTVISELERFAALVAVKEREACAQVAHYYKREHYRMGGVIYRAILARGNGTR